MICLLALTPLLSRATDLVEAKLTDTGPGYSVAASYPVFQDPALAGINDTVRAFVEGLAKPFVEEQGTSLADTADLPDLPPSSLEVAYDTPFVTDRYVLIGFNGYEYSGGAHGMPIIQPLVIDRADGGRIPPEGLFKPDAPWLDRLSSHCLDALSQDEELASDPDWLTSGTEPKAENYQLLYPGPEGLTVIFPPYAVAPYAAGPQEVLIPYSHLADVLDPVLFPR